MNTKNPLLAVMILSAWLAMAASSLAQVIVTNIGHINNGGTALNVTVSGNYAYLAKLREDGTVADGYDLHVKQATVLNDNIRDACRDTGSPAQRRRRGSQREAEEPSSERNRQTSRVALQEVL